MFVLVAQMFQKMPQLKALAPNGSEPPFGITQGLVLAVFVWLIYQAVKRFRRRASAPLTQLSRRNPVRSSVT